MQLGEYSQYFVITVNGVYPLKIVFRKRKGQSLRIELLSELPDRAKVALLWEWEFWDAPSLFYPLLWLPACWFHRDCSCKAADFEGYLVASKRGMGIGEVKIAQGSFVHTDIQPFFLNKFSWDFISRVLKKLMLTIFVSVLIAFT